MKNQSTFSNRISTFLDEYTSMTKKGYRVIGVCDGIVSGTRMEDIKNLRHIKFVVKGGKLYKANPKVNKDIENTLDALL